MCVCVCDSQHLHNKAGEAERKKGKEGGCIPQQHADTGRGAPVQNRNMLPVLWAECTEGFLTVNEEKKKKNTQK